MFRNGVIMLSATIDSVFEFVAAELQKWHATTEGMSEYVFFPTRNVRVRISKALKILA